jgi:hypothetical protein
MAAPPALPQTVPSHTAVLVELSPPAWSRVPVSPRRCPHPMGSPHIYFFIYLFIFSYLKGFETPLIVRITFCLQRYIAQILDLYGVFKLKWVGLLNFEKT